MGAPISRKSGMVRGTPTTHTELTGVGREVRSTQFRFRQSTRKDGPLVDCRFCLLLAPLVVLGLTGCGTANVDDGESDEGTNVAVGDSSVAPNLAPTTGGGLPSGVTDPPAAPAGVSPPPLTTAPDPGHGSMTVEPASVGAGGQVEVRFAGSLSTLHGGYFYLYNQSGSPVAALWSDGNGEPPGATTDLDNFEILDFGVPGSGPDTVVTPVELAPGSYRLCTANSRPEACAELEVTPAG